MSPDRPDDDIPRLPDPGRLGHVGPRLGDSLTEPRGHPLPLLFTLQVGFMALPLPLTRSTAVTARSAPRRPSAFFPWFWVFFSF